MTNADMVRGLQERVARALPAEYVDNVDGWSLRHSPGCSWWVGTALPHGEAAPDTVAGEVRIAEEFYAGHGTAARFQITPGACPEGLETILAERGYRREGLISLQAASTAEVLGLLPSGPLRVRCDDRPTREWFEIWQAVNDHSGDSRAEWNLLERIRRPSAYVAVMLGDEVLAVGRGVVDTGWAGVFGMATLPQARGKGAARTVLAALAGWAGERGAEHMYLQVERDNIPALALYERMGFRGICDYHYRIADRG